MTALFREGDSGGLRPRWVSRGKGHAGVAFGLIGLAILIYWRSGHRSNGSEVFPTGVTADIRARLSDRSRHRN